MSYFVEGTKQQSTRTRGDYKLRRVWGGYRSRAPKQVGYNNRSNAALTMSVYKLSSLALRYDLTLHNRMLFSFKLGK